MANFYDDPSSFPYIEMATLVEDIKIPIPEKLSLEYFEPKFKETHKSTDSGEDGYIDCYYEYNMSKEYEFIHSKLQNLTGKFYVPILTPSVDYGDANDKDNISPNKAGFKSNIRSKAYTTSNFIELTIPKYLLYQFIGNSKDGQNYLIPKGTVFLIASIGGLSKLEKIKIIGISLD